jgi:fatty-acid desaturase
LTPGRRDFNLAALSGQRAFENSARLWACEHRRHYNHADDDEHDPCCISKGPFHARIG